MIITNCSLCKRPVEIAHPKATATGVKEYLLLWDNIDACSIGKEDEIPFPSNIYCHRCIPAVRKWLKRIKPSKKSR